MYVYSCYLYDNGYEHPLNDDSYTEVWRNVIHYYPHLTPATKQRIPYEILDTPSSIGLARLYLQAYILVSGIPAEKQNRAGTEELVKELTGALPGGVVSVERDGDTVLIEVVSEESV